MSTVVGSANQATRARAPHRADQAADAAAVELPETILERRSGWAFLDLWEIWRYRELLCFLTWRDIKVRYKQTVLGAAWAVLQPLATMLVFSLFLGRMAGLSATDLPYPLFVFAGILPWTFFANGITSAGQSVVGSQNLVTKIYFPRALIPLSAIAAGLVDLAIAGGLLALMMIGYGVSPGVEILLLPAILLGLVVAAVGVGLLLSALTVAYRDFRHLAPFLVQLWMFATPCIYLDADSMLDPAAQALMPFNPAYGLIVNFRAAALGTALDYYALAVSSAVSLALLLLGCLYFRKVERSFADVI
jgi:lipopolysaccharide transport system permease protein